MNRVIVIVDNLSAFQITTRVQKVLTRMKRSKDATQFMQDVLTINNFDDFTDVVAKYAIIKHKKQFGKFNNSKNKNFTANIEDNIEQEDEENEDNDSQII
jgi:hypothetical protein